MNKHDLKNLKKRYLIWFYKNTKEQLDKIERKFTQAEIDRFILQELWLEDKEEVAKQFIAEFDAYAKKKEQDGLDQKFGTNGVKPEYLFLTLKLEAIEKAIVKELGRCALKEIKELYEKEMTERILKSTEH